MFVPYSGNRSAVTIQNLFHSNQRFGSNIGSDSTDELPPPHADYDEFAGAIEQGDWATFEQLISSKKNVNATDCWENPLIELVASKGQIKMLERMLESGAKFTDGWHHSITGIKTESYAEKSLHRALYNQKTEMYLFVLREVKKRLPYGEYQSFLNRQLPVVCCNLRNDKINLALVKFLLAEGANINAQNQFSGYTGLMNAARYNPEIALYLLSQDEIDVNVKGNDDKTALHEAAASGQMKVMEELVKKGANLEAVDKRHMTPLAVSLKEGRYEAAKLLVKLGANVNAAQRMYYSTMESLPIMTMLGYYANACDTDRVNFLLALGADPFATAAGHQLSSRDRIRQDIGLDEPMQVTLDAVESHLTPRQIAEKRIQEILKKPETLVVNKPQSAKEADLEALEATLKNDLAQLANNPEGGDAQKLFLSTLGFQQADQTDLENALMEYRQMADTLRLHEQYGSTVN